MANHKSALKRIRTSEKKRLRNRQVRSRMRTEIKKATTVVQQGDLTNARDTILHAVRQLDKAASKGVIHPNNAARHKSRLMKQLHQLETQQQ